MLKASSDGASAGRHKIAMAASDRTRPFFSAYHRVRREKSQTIATVRERPKADIHANARPPPQSGSFGARRNIEAKDWSSGVKEGHTDVPFDGCLKLSGLTSMGELSGGSIMK